MHFYDWNIGEYAKKTQHLTNEEDLAYRRALDMYYDTEKPLLTDGLATLSRRLRVDQQALKNVLDEFFPDGINKHAEEKITAYYAYVDKQKANGKLGGRPKRTQAKPTAKPKEPTAKPTLTTNHEPIPNTQYPISKNKYTPPINGELLADWLKVRKAKRSGELTETAFKGLQREARTAGITDEQAVKVCCERSWQSFKAEWYLKKPNNASQSVQEARLDTARQIFGGKNGTNRQNFDIDAIRTIEGDGESFPEAIPRIR